MCDDKFDYIYLPPQFIGGPTGNYYIDCPVKSNQYTEYGLVAIAGGDTGPTDVIISGNYIPQTNLNWTGVTSYGLESGTSGNNSSSPIDGQVYRVAATTSLTPNLNWFRVANAQNRLYIRIDAQNNISCYVTIAFRNAILKRIQGPIKAMPQDMVVRGDYNQIHHEREKRIQESVFGVTGEQETLDKRVVNLGRIKR